MAKPAREHKRLFTQLTATLLQNPFLANLFQANLYKGALKGVCVPGLNCYACPAAVGACPLGALQTALAAPGHKGLAYAVGALLLFGVLLGRFICGWLCPIGLLQDCLHKIPSKKVKNKQTWLRYIKYAVLVVFVIVLPLITLLLNGLGTPAFCKLVCPSGTAAGVWLLSFSEPLRQSAGFQFLAKLCILLAILVGSVFLFRPFCKVLCPLGALYGLFNRISLLGLHKDDTLCTNCQKCDAVCPMGALPSRHIHSAECIRCGKCVTQCPTGALRLGLPQKRRKTEQA